MLEGALLRSALVTTSTAHRRRYPLHVYIATLFTALVMATGILIAGVDYANARRLALGAVADLFERSARETLAELRAGHESIRTLVALLAQQQNIAKPIQHGRLESLPLIRRGLDSAPLLSTLYVAFTSGDLFSIRRLDHAAARRAEKAPDAAIYLVRLAHLNNTQASELLYDASMRLIAKRTGRGQLPPSPPWVSIALAQPGTVRTDAFTLASQEIGFAIAEATPERNAVVGADLTLKNLSATLSRQRASPSAILALVDGNGRVLAASHGAWPSAGEMPAQLPTLRDLDLPVLAQAFARGTADQGTHTLHHEGRNWESRVVASEFGDGAPLFVVMAAPHDELLAGVQLLRRHALLSLLAVLLAAVPVTWWIARRISFSLRALAADARSIRHFSFDSHDVESLVLEVDDLGQAMSAMRSTIRQFHDISARLAAERHFQPLLDHLIDQTVAIARADAGAVYLVNDADRTVTPAAWKNVPLARLVHPPSALPCDAAPVSHPLREACRLGSATAGRLAPFGLPAGLEWVGACFPGQEAAFLAVPLCNREGKANGVLFLVKSAVAADFSSEQAAFVNALSGPLAIAIDNQRLMQAQKNLLDAVIRVMAGAIDAKSPYTGAHCQRVPEIALMLARAACAAQEGPFRDFRLNEDEWETLSIAAWLHDCGKLTTPEYVVDKATKLETLNNRIHEIRTRFEVIKRDVEIAYWRAVAAGGDAVALQVRRNAELAALDADFAFVAACNVGSENLSATAHIRLAQIASRTWTRTLDDRLGISQTEKRRKDMTPAPVLPVVESLIADRDDHCIPHDADMQRPSDMNVRMPRHRLNLGELHSLTVSSGTLTEEERFLINNHIIQTIVMLRGLPFPDYLRGVPDIAGNHHEHLDGSGYPRGITAEAMSPLARIVAIADIFEALTASDRPYKPGKPLSAAVALLADHVRRGHLDADLFALFLRSEVHVRFAQRFLDPRQIDQVDIDATIASVKQAGPGAG